MEKTYKVYKHTAPNGKSYIGITRREAEQRWKNGFGYRKNSYFFRAIEKYGWNNFQHEILLDGLSAEEAESWEQFFIAIYRSNEKDYGFNLTGGGEKQFFMSDVAKSNMVKNHADVRGEKNPIAKSVVQYSVDGDGIKIWGCAHDAGKQFNRRESNITKCCRGETATAYGFVWRYGDKIMAKETRVVQLNEFRAEKENEDMILEGYAAVFNQPTVLYVDARGNEFKEVITRNAFDQTDMKKCCLKYNHESNVPVLARVRGGSLELSVDDYGLHFRAKLFNTQTGRDIYELVKAGGIDECSFAFTIPEGGDIYDPATRTRSINSIDTLWDCSVVDHPAYTEGTTVSARSFFEAEAEKERLESLEQDRARLALKLKLER